jgi:ribosomal protein L22
MAAVEERRSVSAQAKWVRMSARKARVVAEHIRGRSVPEARTVLAFTPRAAAREIEKVLRSAVANAEANHGLIGDELYVERAVVDEGPTLKRWRARARGRVARIRKRTCHITVTLAETPVVQAPPKTQPKTAAAEVKPKRETATKKAATAKKTDAKPKRKAPAKKKETTA